MDSGPDRDSAAPRQGGDPIHSAVRCAHCGQSVDPLRAARVAIFYDRFRYFCSIDCRERYDPEASRTPLPQPSRKSRPNPEWTSAEVISTRLAKDSPGLEARRKTARALAVVAGDPLSDLSGGPDTEIRDPEPSPNDQVPDSAGETEEAAAVGDIGTLLLTLAMVGGLLGFALLLAGTSRVALTSRLIVVVVAAGALFAHFMSGRRDPAAPHPFALLAAPAAGVLAGTLAWLSDHPRTGSALTLVGLVIAATAGGTWMMYRARRPVEDEREQLLADLDVVAQRVVGNDVAAARATDLCPGEEIVVGPGEVVAADAAVTAGSAKIQPWRGAQAVTSVSEGDSIVAGARVLEGRLRAVVGWAGHDRAWYRLTNDPRRRADLLAHMTRVGRIAAERGAPLVAGLAALSAYAANHDLLGVGMFAIAAQAAIATPAVAQVGALYVARTVLESLRRGIVFRSAEALERAGKVSVAAFCARGTLLLGEPEVATVDAVGSHEPERVLSLLAGTESGSHDPIASAILRAARMRGVRPDAVRSPMPQPGLGVTAVAASGQPLVVGSRALMLRERISVAAAEAKVLDLEAMGRMVLLVALGGRLMGVVGLQDGLRPGARAAVQHVLDAGVEPVLLSGDSRETCEAIGRVLDIEHIRPEVLPADRGDEVRRLADGGAMVAVIGVSPVDAAALSAADVSLALASAGSTTSEWHAGLVSDDVRDAAYAIRLAHACRTDVWMGLGLSLGSGVLGAVAVVFGLAPPVAAPLLAFGGLLATVYRLRLKNA